MWCVLAYLPVAHIHVPRRARSASPAPPSPSLSTGVGFAFGGVEPGRLHAKGKLIEVHRLLYSIGRAGTYKLHVCLSHQMQPMPGSPFDLHVVPGPASATTTMVPPQLKLRGDAGEDDAGCRLTLQSFDSMGNRCTEGGAKVHCTSSYAEMTTSTTDNGDGTYTFAWASHRAGTYSVSVWIDNEQVPGRLDLIGGSSGSQ